MFIVTQPSRSLRVHSLAPRRHCVPRDHQCHAVHLLRSLFAPIDVILYQQITRLRLLSITLHLERDERIRRLAYPP
ncbi:hypothetical protein FIBSPDRAFT_875379 [Athelia psychrophila]|uniref:Uncharacterized protein n=1 Tax=Athelia psychrophila TaxID=1759441 RepID=A0A165WBC5_9AGAM|nr:hypothetical protein FIBSPDRAFT_875379 [Fibularhizoctonia sp. CBS 109695]